MTLPRPFLDPIPCEASLEQFQAMEFFIGEWACIWPRVPYALRRDYGFDIADIDKWVRGVGLSEHDLGRRNETMPAFSVIVENMSLFYTPEGILHPLGRQLLAAAIPMYANGATYPTPTEPLAISFRRFVFEIRIPLPGRHAFAVMPPQSMQ